MHRQKFSTNGVHFKLKSLFIQKSSTLHLTKKRGYRRIAVYGHVARDRRRRLFSCLTRLLSIGIALRNGIAHGFGIGKRIAYGRLIDRIAALYVGGGDVSLLPENPVAINVT